MRIARGSPADQTDFYYLYNVLTRPDKLAVFRPQDRQQAVELICAWLERGDWAAVPRCASVTPPAGAP